MRFYLAGDFFPRGIWWGLGIQEKKTPCILYLFCIDFSDLDEYQTVKMQGIFIYLHFVLKIQEAKEILL